MQYECYLNRCPCVANALFLTEGWLNPQVQFPQTWKAHSIAVLNSVSFFSVLNKGILSCLVLSRNVDWKHCDRVFLFSPESLAIDSYNFLLVWGAQSCPTLCDPVDCSLPGSSVHGISQARILEWAALSFSRGSSQSRDWICVSSLDSLLLSHLESLISIIIIKKQWVEVNSRDSTSPKVAFFLWGTVTSKGSLWQPSGVASRVQGTVPKQWRLPTVVLEKTPETPLDSKEIKP